MSKRIIILIIILMLLMFLFLLGCSGSELYTPPYPAAEVERQKFEAEQGHPTGIRIATIRFK